MYVEVNMYVTPDGGAEWLLQHCAIKMILKLKV